MSRVARIGLALIAVLLAPLLLVQGFAQASVPLGPGREYNGFFRALQAMSRVELRQSGQSVSLQVQDRGAQLAREAYIREPYATDALFVLAAEKRQRGELDGMNAVIQGAYALDKRSRSVGVLQLEQAVAAGDFAQTFAVVERLSTVYPSLKQSFVSPLVAALDRPGAPALMLAALEQEPVWAADFWQALPSDAKIAVLMYDLRRRTDAGTSPASDARLLAILVDTGRYEEAFDLWRTLTGDAGNSTAFVADTSYAPFGWQLQISGKRSITLRDDKLEAYVQNDTSGELARQLVRLSPGSYTLTAQIVPASEAANFGARLQCVSADDQLGAVQTLDGVVRWSVPASDCPAWWLIVEGSAWNRRTSLRATISELAFGRAG